MDIFEISKLATKIKVELHELQDEVNAQYNP